MTGKCIALTTVGTLEEARRLSHTLVERRLVACVNIVPAVESVYRWKGKVESSGELLLVIKTSKERFPALRDALAALHPYDLPELVLVEIADGNPAYIDWIGDSVMPEQ